MKRFPLKAFASPRRFSYQRPCQTICYNKPLSLAIITRFNPVFQHRSIHESPSKDDLLAKTSSRLRRLQIHFKYLMIKSHRPFNGDEISALFSWLVLGNIVWIIIGTTTFFSLIIASLNTVFAQETLAQSIGKYITKETGLKVLFESAIVPRWRDGTISFNNVFVSRRPKNLTDSHNNDSEFRKTLTDDDTSITSQENPEQGSLTDDGNYTQFDVMVRVINIKLSFVNWLNGKGIVSSIDLKGIRGIVDRRHVHWSPDMEPKNYKNVWKWGDFEVQNFTIDDLLLTVYQPGNVEPFDFSVYSCDLPKLRKHWLFHDFLSANHIIGTYDGSPFSLYPKQKDIGILSDIRESRLKFHDLNINHLTKGIESAFGWIYRGQVDITVDIEFPPNPQSPSIYDISSSILDNIKNESNTSTQSLTISNQDQLKFHFQVLMNDTKAYVPFFTDEISYSSNALLRPIVAYINSRKTTIPLYFSVIKCVSEFEGSWTIYDSSFMDDISQQVYLAFADSLTNQELQRERLKKVGFWSLQMASSLLLLSFGTFSPV